MSTLVLARKYRPKTFEQMVGQPHVVQALVNALGGARLHHAYLFTGTRGVGKTTVSRILAKSLNCIGPDGNGGITATPCGACPACSEIDAGRHADYIELDAASNRSVEEMTDLLGRAMYKPASGRFKIYMIDEVHMLSGHAFNAMLKTLEEPPEYLKFVLATTDPQKVPVTVLSRCLQFNLRPLPAALIAEHLAHVLQAEGVAHDAASLKLLARAARGSMRDALSLADQAIAHGGGALAEADVRGMLGAVDRGHAVRLAQALARGDGRAAIGVVDELRAAGLSAAGALEELAALAQQVAVLQAVPDATDADDPDAAAAQRLAPMLAADETQLLYSLALHGREELALAPDEYAALVMVLLRFLAFKPSGGEARRGAEPEPATEPARKLPLPLAGEGGGEGEGLGDRWAMTVAQLAERPDLPPLARELAMQSQCIANDGIHWSLRVESDSLRAQADKLRAALAAQLGARIDLAIERGPVTDTPALRAAAVRDRRQRAAEQLVHDDPLVQDMLRQFKTARIVPGSIKPH